MPICQNLSGECKANWKHVSNWHPCQTSCVIIAQVNYGHSERKGLASLTLIKPLALVSPHFFSLNSCIDSSAYDTFHTKECILEIKWESPASSIIFQTVILTVGGTPSEHLRQNFSSFQLCSRWPEFGFWFPSIQQHVKLIKDFCDPDSSIQTFLLKNHIFHLDIPLE